VNEGVVTATVLTKCRNVSTIETDQRFSRRDDLWIIVVVRSEDETEIWAGEAAGGRRAVIKMFKSASDVDEWRHVDLMGLGDLLAGIDPPRLAYSEAVEGTRTSPRRPSRSQ
jgi:hypothetical protein